MTDRPGLDFSFSGLKTFTLTTVHQKPRKKEPCPNKPGRILRPPFEQAVVDNLVIKCRRALKQTGLKRLVMAGGVSANKSLRRALESMVQSEGAEVCFMPGRSFVPITGR